MAIAWSKAGKKLTPAELLTHLKAVIALQHTHSLHTKPPVPALERRSMPQSTPQRGRSGQPLRELLRVPCGLSRYWSCRSDHNQILSRWYALYDGWADAPLRGEWVRAPEP
eukprot:2801120-Pleurochrysis_carterae.AAC.1